jgi:hypothetical protein
MPRFEPWFLELITVVSSVVVAVAAAAGVAGLWQWRNELIGRSRFEVARRIMMLGFRFRDIYAQARNPITWPGEYDGRVKQQNEKPDEVHIRDEYYAHFNRLKPLFELTDKLQEVMWEASLLLDQGDETAANHLLDAAVELRQAIDRHFYAQLEMVRHPNIAVVNYEQDLDLTKVVYGMADDKYNKRIDATIEQMKARFKKYIR